MLEISILILGISFIAASLFLTYRQEKKVGHELRKREVRLNRLLQQVNNLLDRLENRYSELDKQKENNIKQDNLNKQTEESFVNTLESKFNEASQQDKVVQDANEEDEKLDFNSKAEKRERINELFDSGFNYSEIAQQLNMGCREVELICKLND